MSVTVINMRELQNAAGVPAYPDSPPNTIYAEDWNPVRAAISKGTSGIYTKGAKVGSDGFQTIGDTPFLMASGLIRFQNDAASGDPQVGYLSNDGEFGMQKIRTDQQALYSADVDFTFEGDATRSVPETAPTDWHLITQRGAGEVEDLEVYHDGSLEVMRLLQGDFVANKIGSGFVMRFATNLSRIRMHASGYPVIEDADDFTARPTTWTNERRIMTGTDVFVDDVIGVAPIVVTEPSSDPKVKQVSIANIPASALAIGAGATDVNVDALMSGGGGTGSLAELTTPAEVALIATNAAAISALQAEIALCVKTLRTATGDTIYPSGGQVLFANSSTVLFDRPAANTIRAVSSGGGGGGGSVDSVTAGNGMENIGTATNPILQLDLKAAGGLQFSSGELEVAFAGSGGDLGTNTLPARSDHTHDALYSLLGHTHAAYAAIADITFEQLDSIGDVGTVASTLAAGNDARFHTQGTDLGTTLDGVFLANSARVGAAPATGQRGFGVERGGAANAHVVFDDSDDLWKVGIVGDLEAIVRDDDARLETFAGSGAVGLVPDPGSETGKVLTDDGTWQSLAGSGDMTKAVYDTGDTGRVDQAEAVADGVDSTTAAQVAVAYAHSQVGPGNPHGVTAGDVGADVAGSAASALATALAADVDEEVFTGFATVISLTEKLIGGPVAPGVTVRRDGTLNVGRLRADVDLAPGSQIDVTVSNLTTPASAVITLTALSQSVEELALGIPFAAGEQLDAVITAVAGVPGVSQLMLELVRE